MLACAVTIVGCSPSVVRVLHQEDLTATFYDAKCTDAKVLAVASRYGIPAMIVADMKSGSVIFTNGEPKRNFCYRDSKDGSVTFIVDDSGSMGNLQLPPK
jgi:hypothetical protein